MDPFKFLGSRFRRPDPTARGEVAYDFDRISAYFHRCGTEGAASLQRIDADTTFDLDLHEVFERIDRTTTPVGRQMLYARLRTLRGPDDCKAFAERTAFFEHDPERAGRCTAHLGLLAKEDASTASCSTKRPGYREFRQHTQPLFWLPPHSLQGASVRSFSSCSSHCSW